MKKNKMMRVASALLIAVLLSTCAISGTFAKYVTEGSGSDSARVAKWGVDIEVAVDGAFAAEYDADTTVSDTNGTAIAKTVVSANGTDKILAPGTSGALLDSAAISGTPEVAVNVKKNATLVLTGWEVNGAYYCPLTITVDNDVINGMDYETVDEFINAVEAKLDSDTNYAPNADLTAAHSVAWEWAFENGVEQTNDKDTSLGDAAADGTEIKIEFTLEITVTQID